MHFKGSCNKHPASVVQAFSSWLHTLALNSYRVIRKNILFLFLAGAPVSPLFAGAFNPSISLIGSYTYVRDFVTVSSGDVSVNHRNINFGFEFSNEFFLKNDFFLKTGIRYQQYHVTVSAPNPIHSLSWGKLYESFAVPILAGKHFYDSKGRMGSVYLGGSFGVITTPFVYSESSYSLTRYGSGASEGIGNSRDSLYPKPLFFFPTIDVGADYHFFKSPRLSLGVLLSFQLNHTTSYSCSGSVQETISGEQYSYQIQAAHQFFTGSVLFSYRFGKRSKMPEPKLMQDWSAPK